MILYPIVSEEEKSKYRRKDDEKNYVCKLVKCNFLKWEWEIVDIVPTNGDAFSLASKIERDQRRLALIYNCINGKKNVIRHPGVSFKVDLLGAPRITGNMISTQKKIDKGEFPTEPFPGTFKTWWQRRKEQEERKQAQERCKTCDFYSGQKELLCAVHPHLKFNCNDFQPKQERPSVKLGVTHQTSEPFCITDLSEAQLYYCMLVITLDDWTDYAYCTRLLIEKYNEVQDIWGDSKNPKLQAAANIAEQELQHLQDVVSRLETDDEKHFFRQGMNFLAATSFY